MIKFTKVVFELQNRLLKNNLPIAHVNLIAEYVLKDNMNNLLLNDGNLTTEQYKKMIAIVEIFENENVPIAQIVGFEYFYNYKFIVSDKCLIPRIETEELVYNAVEFCKKNFTDKKKLRIYDCCCGSGAIAISTYLELRKYFEIELFLSDLSQSAISICKENLAKHKIKATVNICGGVDKSFEKIDLFLSNPPYIPNNEFVDQLVKDHEPHVALFGGENGLDVYFDIMNDLGDILSENYFVGFEHGENHHAILKKIINEKIPAAKCFKNYDMFDRERNTFAFNFGEL